MNVELYRVDRKNAGEWDEIVHESSHGTIFHTWDWLNIAATHSGFALHPLMGSVNDEPIGLLPLFQKKQFGINLVVSPPPHTALLYLGPVLRFDAVQQQSKRERLYVSFLDAINDYIRQELKAQYVQIFLPPALSDPRPFTWSGYTVKPEYSYVTDLSPGAEHLFLSLPKKKRQDINRAQKRGLTVETGGKHELEAVYNLMVDRYREQGRTVRVPKEYLCEIYDAYPENVKIFVARSEGDIVTGLIDILYENTLLSWIGNPKPLKNISPSPNDLLVWEEIQYCCKQGLTSYVTMGTAGNERLHTYYSSKFNPNLDIRFSAKKCSSFVVCMESAYTNVYKPVTSSLKRREFS
ncbi:lipid II:glycine glycyltransferase FemX [Methanogenium cariaci]|jgi:GNAT acetyltransferase-like protein